MNASTSEPETSPEMILSEHFTTLATAPDGVQKLRELILTLAVQGRLVPQDPEDEPASVLLERIATEKERLVAEGTIKKQKALPPVDPEKVPFAVPEGWVWTRMGEIGSWSTGGTPSRSISEYFGGEIRWIKSGNLNDSVLYETDETISKQGLENSNAKLLPIGSVSVALYGATIGKTSILGVEATTNQACANCIPFHKFLYNRYLFFYILEERMNFISVGQGGAQPNLTNKIIHEWYLPLPPLAEQHRIVERVDALMALCDDLESQQSTTESTRRELVAAILNQLTGGETAEERVAAWDMLKDRFSEICCTVEDVANLRETVLSLAVQGRLTEQNPEDEPASVLLERIAEEKERLVAEGTIKKQKALPPVDLEEVPFEVPEGWVWIRLGEITSKIGSGITPRGGKAVYCETGVNFLRSQNVWNDGLRLENVAKIPANVHKKMSNTAVFPNDILLNITGASIGRSSQVPENFQEANVSQHVSIIRAINVEITSFLHLTIISGYFQQLIMNQQVGISREGLSKKVLQTFWLPLPPLAEQHRIVERVDALMALCDELEERIARQQEMAGKLTEAVCAAMSG